MSQLCGSGLSSRSYVTSAAPTGDVVSTAQVSAVATAADFVFIIASLNPSSSVVSSPRKRGPIFQRQRGTSPGRDARLFERPVVMGPRLRGDDRVRHSPNTNSTVAFDSVFISGERASLAL